jgi:hypothetical protein
VSECTTDDTNGRLAISNQAPIRTEHQPASIVDTESQEKEDGGPRGLRARQKPLRLFVNLKLASNLWDCVGGRGLSANAAAADCRGRICVDEIDIPPPQVGSHGFVTPATVVAGFAVCLL